MRLGKMDEKIRKVSALIDQAYEILLSLAPEERDMVEFDVRIGLSDRIRRLLGGSYIEQCEAESEFPSSYHLAPFEKFKLAVPVQISLNG